MPIFKNVHVRWDNVAGNQWNPKVISSVLPRQSPAQYSQIEQDALKLAQEMTAEFWAVSSLTGRSTSGINKFSFYLPKSGKTVTRTCKKVVLSLQQLFVSVVGI